jgi:hypothetical protein
VICRANQAKERIERQADRFAGCLLMPEGWVRMIWRDQFSRSTPLIFSAWQDPYWVRPPVGRNAMANIPGHLAGTFDAAAVAYFFFKTSRIMAPWFNVSIEAMQVRLEQLGLLLVDDPHQRSLALST